MFSKNNNRLFIFLMSFLAWSPMLMSQNESYGTWTSMGVEKEYKKWDFGAETELRTIYYTRLIERWSLGVNADYSLFKQLKVGVGYQFMNKLDQKYLNYSIRNRFNLGATGKLKLADFSFTLRERIQMTQKDDSKRIQDDGTIDTYSVNPEWSWRNRLAMAYNIPHFKVTPSFSVESFYQLNNPDGNTFDNMRYVLSFDYKINKHNNIEIYGVINSNLESDDATGKYILGVSYKHTL